MTTPLHTPGPWQDDGKFIVAPDPQGIHPDIYIAEIVQDDDEGRLASPEQQAANGALIAAATEMLDALFDIKRLAEKSGDSEADPFALLDLIADKARAAIPEATQREGHAPRPSIATPSSTPTACISCRSFPPQASISYSPTRRTW